MDSKDILIIGSLYLSNDKLSLRRQLKNLDFGHISREGISINRTPIIIQSPIVLKLKVQIRRNTHLSVHCDFSKILLFGEHERTLLSSEKYQRVLTKTPNWRLREKPFAYLGKQEHRTNTYTSMNLLHPTYRQF